METTQKVIGRKEKGTCPSNDSKQDRRNVRPNKEPKSEKKRKSHSPKKCGQTLAERPPFVIG